jgi:hypothetical protein
MLRLTDKKDPIDIPTAKATLEMVNAITNVSRLELDYIKFAGGSNTSAFLESPAAKKAQPRLPASATSGEPSAHNPFPARRQ